MSHSLKRLVIAGGSGYLGSSLAEYYRTRAEEIIILTRHPKPAQGNIHFVLWDAQHLGEWQKYFCGADAVLNLTGKSVNCRYTPENKQEIIDSRVNSARVVGEAIAACADSPPVWLNASSATTYPPTFDHDRTEESLLDPHGFSEDVCRRWEKAFEEAPAPGVRKVALRTSFVLGPSPCDAFDAFKNLVTKGLGGSMAGGRHWVSWLHAEDFCRAVEWIITHPELHGPINMTAPHPLTNADFMRDFRRAYKMPIGLPSARWMLEIGARGMGTETELILKSRRVVPKKLLDSGFIFQYPTWPEALASIVESNQ